MSKTPFNIDRLEACVEHHIKACGVRLKYNVGFGGGGLYRLTFVYEGDALSRTQMSKRELADASVMTRKVKGAIHSAVKRLAFGALYDREWVEYWVMETRGLLARNRDAWRQKHLPAQALGLRVLWNEEDGAISLRVRRSEMTDDAEPQTLTRFYPIVHGDDMENGSFEQLKLDITERLFEAIKLFMADNGLESAAKVRNAYLKNTAWGAF